MHQWIPFIVILIYAYTELKHSLLYTHRKLSILLYTELPDLHEREEIFRKLLLKVKTEDDFDLDLCASRTRGYSSSDIVAVCKAAMAIPLRELRNKLRASSNVTETELPVRPLTNIDIDQALRSVYPSSKPPPPSDSSSGGGGTGGGFCQSSPKSRPGGTSQGSFTYRGFTAPVGKFRYPQVDDASAGTGKGSAETEGHNYEDPEDEEEEEDDEEEE